MEVAIRTTTKRVDKEALIAQRLLETKKKTSSTHGNISEQIILRVLCFITAGFMSYFDLILWKISKVKVRSQMVDSSSRKASFCVRTTNQSLFIGKRRCISTNFRLTYLKV